MLKKTKFMYKVAYRSHIFNLKLMSKNVEFIIYEYKENLRPERVICTLIADIKFITHSTKSSIHFLLMDQKITIQSRSGKLSAIFHVKELFFSSAYVQSFILSSISNL